MTGALCIDLGGTNLRAGLATSDGQGLPIALGAWPAPTDVEGFRRLIGGLLDEHAILRMGIAIPGLASQTRCRWVPNLPYLDGFDLAKMFPGVKVALGNDAQLALLAEAQSGAAKDASNALLLAVGTGIGSAVLADGRIVRGHLGSATSFGWASADIANESHETLGWLERKASGRALDNLARQAGLTDGAALIEAARAGDAAAISLVAEPAAALGTALAGAVSLLGSRVIVVSGGVAEGLDVLGPLVLNILRRQLPPHMREISMMKGAYGSGASLAGAALAAHGSPLWVEHET